jgi:hypothetical protein
MRGSCPLSIPLVIPAIATPRNIHQAPPRWGSGRRLITCSQRHRGLTCGSKNSIAPLRLSSWSSEAKGCSGPRLIAHRSVRRCGSVPNHGQPSRLPISGKACLHSFALSSSLHRTYLHSYWLARVLCQGARWRGFAVGVGAGYLGRWLKMTRES